MGRLVVGDLVVGVFVGVFVGNLVGVFVGLVVGAAVGGVVGGTSAFVSKLVGEGVEPGKATLVYSDPITSKAIFCSKHSHAIARLSPPPPSLYRASI